MSNEIRTDPRYCIHYVNLIASSYELEGFTKLPIETKEQANLRYCLIQTACDRNSIPSKAQAVFNKVLFDYVQEVIYNQQEQLPFRSQEGGAAFSLIPTTPLTVSNLTERVAAIVDRAPPFTPKISIKKEQVVDLGQIQMELQAKQSRKEAKTKELQALGFIPTPTLEEQARLEEQNEFKISNELANASLKAQNKKWQEEGDLVDSILKAQGQFDLEDEFELGLEREVPRVKADLCGALENLDLATPTPLVNNETEPSQFKQLFSRLAGHNLDPAQHCSPEKRALFFSQKEEELTLEEVNQVVPFYHCDTPSKAFDEARLNILVEGIVQTAIDRSLNALHRESKRLKSLAELHSAAAIASQNLPHKLTASKPVSANKENIYPGVNAEQGVKMAMPLKSSKLKISQRRQSH